MSYPIISYYIILYNVLYVIIPGVGRAAALR